MKIVLVIYASVLLILLIGYTIVKWRNYNKMSKLLQTFLHNSLQKCDNLIDGPLKKYEKTYDAGWIEKYRKKNPLTMNQFKKFRKKPVIVEAFQTNEEMKIQTLEGEMTAKPGDWIIRGVNGELYPCKPDVFEKTYEPVDDK